MLCSYCDYDLTGLPDRHICPECGKAYDANDVIVILGDNRRRWRWIEIPAGLILVCMICMMFWRARGGAVWMPIFFLLYVIALFAQVFKPIDRRKRMILSERGAQFLHPNLDGCVIPWRMVASAKYSWTDGYLRLKRSNGRKLFSCSYRILGGSGVARRCAREINRWIERHNSDSDVSAVDARTADG